MLQWIAQNFQKAQYGLIAITVIMAWYGFRSRTPKSQFKKREADRTDLGRLRNGEDLAKAKLSKRNEQRATPPPLSLPGIRLQGEAHEILGVRKDATEAEIMKAYKDAIKQYHPDRIQGQAQEQIKFYQEASARLNQAKEKMLQRFRS